MELTINLIHPLTVFVLRQFGKLIIVSMEVEFGEIRYIRNNLAAGEFIKCNLIRLNDLGNFVIMIKRMVF